MTDTSQIKEKDNNEEEIISTINNIIFCLTYLEYEAQMNGMSIIAHFVGVAAEAARDLLNDLEGKKSNDDCLVSVTRSTMH